MYTVKITNCYTNDDGSVDEIVTEALVTSPPEGCDYDDLTAWFEDEVWQHTGTGRESGNSGYFAEIIAADREDHLGQWYEWV